MLQKRRRCCRAVRFPSSLGIGPVRRVTPKRRTYWLYFTRECPCTVEFMSVLDFSTRQGITTLDYDAKSASEKVEKTVLTSPGWVVLSIIFNVILPPFHREDLWYLYIVRKKSFNDYGGRGSQFCPRFGRRRNENSPSRGHI